MLLIRAVFDYSSNEHGLALTFSPSALHILAPNRAGSFEPHYLPGPTSIALVFGEGKDLSSSISFYS